MFCACALVRVRVVVCNLLMLWYLGSDYFVIGRRYYCSGCLGSLIEDVLVYLDQCSYLI